MALKFENENTWLKASKSGQTSEFHRKYEESIEKVREQFRKRYPNIIDGKEVYSNEGEFEEEKAQVLFESKDDIHVGEGEFENRSPNDKRLLIGIFQKGTRKDTSNAIEAALKAFDQWRKVKYKERITIFCRAADIFSERKYELAAWMSFENGKNRFEAIADVDETIDLTRYYCLILGNEKGFDKKMGKAVPEEETSSILKPYGVWGVISPFNFPLAIATGMSVGALITGNTVVFKPSSDTPLMGFMLYKVLKQAGLPKGVFNYVSGQGNTVGEEIVENPNVGGIIFTGSKEVGLSAYSRFIGKFPRPFIAELGGKNPVIVSSKADLENAAEGIVRAAFGYGGQKCSAASRVYIDKKIKNKFVELLKSKTEGLPIGNSINKDSFLGPLINEKAYRNFQSYAEIAFKDGCIVTGGHIIKKGDLKYGFYVEPTIVDSLPKNHRLFKEELFVPILCISEINGIEEGIKLANNVDYGLTAGIFTQDVIEGQKFLDDIDSGVVYINRKMGATTGAMAGSQPFVGWKMSGTSGKGAGGLYYLQQFLREQSQTKYS